MPSTKFHLIHVAIYRLHVVVTWESSAEAIAKYAKAHQCEVAKRFIDDFRENSEDALGMCMKFRNDNPDVLVWVKEKPTRATTFATLYHELYHAVDSISESRNLGDEIEARAYLYEYLANEMNMVLW